MTNPKNATPVEDMEPEEEFFVEDVETEEEYSMEDIEAEIEMMEEAIQEEFGEPEDFPTKARGVGAKKQKRDWLAKERDKSVKEILHETASKRGKSARDGAKPIYQKQKNADKKSKGPRES